MTPKLLSKEDLETVMDVAETQPQAQWSQLAVLKLLAHIAALLEELQSLRKSKALIQKVGEVARGLRPGDVETDTVIGPLLGKHREALEEARYADDNVKAFTQAFCEVAEAAIRHAEAPRGGQHVPFHGDFSNLPPSAIGRLRRWARDGRAALAGNASLLLVRARNEGLEKAAAVVESADDGVPLQMLADDGIRAMKEPEE